MPFLRPPSHVVTYSHTLPRTLVPCNLTTFTLVRVSSRALLTRFKAKKMEEVPRRCFKCQQIGHLASKCKEISVICPNCAGAHTGEECRADTNRYRCINCSKAGRPANHASWDHTCPSMEVEKRKRATRNPDSQYRYFSTDEVWTWAKKDVYSDEEAQGVGIKWDARVGGTEFERRADKGWKGMRDMRSIRTVVPPDT